MSLDPLDYLPVARRAANALRRRYPFLDAQDVHGQAQLVLVEVARRYDPANCDDPERYLAWAIHRRLLDWLRQHAPYARSFYRRHRVRPPRHVPLPANVAG